MSTSRTPNWQDNTKVVAQPKDDTKSIDVFQWQARSEGRGYLLACTHQGCSATVWYRHKTIGDDGQDYAILARKARDDGWTIKGKKVQCRDHRNVQKAQFANMKKDSDMKTDKVKVATPVNGAVVDVDTVFRINDAILPHYQDKVGYEPGWTDSRIATDLGLDISQVEYVRSKRFGPAGDEHAREMETIYENTGQLFISIKKRADIAQAKMDQIEAGFKAKLSQVEADVKAQLGELKGDIGMIYDEFDKSDKVLTVMREYLKSQGRLRDTH
jgi:hypothetical protein